jgi:hypothetical protein
VHTGFFFAVQNCGHVTEICSDNGWHGGALSSFSTATAR